MKLKKIIHLCHQEKINNKIKCDMKGMVKLIELNNVYCTNNLELLKQMNDESVDLIYCDILYNTGRRFKDYDDKLGTPQEAVEWYRPRLVEMKRVLKDTGSIYLHMDYRLVHYVKIEMDNIFGISNFKNHITWKRQNSAGAKANSRYFARNSDDILYYAKTKDYKWTGSYKDYDEKYLKRFSHKDENGRRFMDCRLGNYSDDTIKELEKDDRIYITKNGKKRLKRYLDEQKGLAVDTIWIDIFDVNSQSKEKYDYDTQKPKALLERIIKASSNKGDVVADFFMGSGTTMVVAKELGRQYIGCDINPRAIEITNQRLDEVGEHFK